MKTTILLLALVLETSLPAAAVRLDFSGVVTVADDKATSVGFGVGHLFTGALTYDPDYSPINDRNFPHLQVFDSIWGTAPAIIGPLRFTDGPPDTVSFWGECALLNWLSINLTDVTGYALNGQMAPNGLSLADWSSGEISASCNQPSSFGNWTGEILIPRIQIAPEPGVGLLLTGAMVGLLVVSARRPVSARVKASKPRI